VKVCSNCGKGNDDDALFCAFCNHFLEWTEVARLVPKEPIRDGGAPGEPGMAPTAGPDRHPPLPSTFPPRGEPATRAAAAADPAPVTPPPAAPMPPTPEPQAIASPSAQSGPAENLERSRQVAAARGRTDLVEQIDHTRRRLAVRPISVVVVGEFKKGKSTLVNAMLQTAVCPADADLVTVVPTIVRFGEKAEAYAYLEPVADAEPERIPVPLDRIADFSSEQGNPANRRHLRSVEVLLGHRMLRTGLSLVDTPGVGGLESAHGIITMSALDLADGLLFVTDASTELTAPEVDFLRRAMQRCPVAACVVTKTDLYPEWRRIAELDRGHLGRAGIDIPVIEVSSFLRLAARRDSSLTAEPGFPALVEYLASTVLPMARTRAGAEVAGAAEFVADQLDREVSAERQVLERPDQAGQVVERLRSAAGRAAALASPNASWQQVLGDGLQDLVAEVEHDLAERLRAVLRDVESVIDDGDPKAMWDGIGMWLRNQVVAVAVANFDTLAAAAAELAAEVGSRFALDAGEPVRAMTGAPPESLQALALAPASTLVAPGGRFGAILLSTRTAAFVPMALFGVAGSLLGAVIVAPISVALAAGIGRKMIKDEKKRQLAYRRQQAKAAARKYVEEVGFVLNKESRDALRRTGRQLRDEFTQRAATIHRSTVGALHAAEHASTLDPAARQARAADVERQAAELATARASAGAR